MLFNSIEFLIFLPVTLLLYILLKRHAQHEIALSFLVVASLFFYGWWNPSYLILLVVSIGLNYQIGRLLSNISRAHKKLLLGVGVGLNLASIAYFKYSVFLLVNVNTVFNTHFSVGDVVLPLAISFFTFQQIAYLVDSYKGITREYNFSHYMLFVSFFPQLIAGPIVHHKDMLPQFAEAQDQKKLIRDIGFGLSIFSIGLFKKTVLADGIAVYASPVFQQAGSVDVDFLTAWGGALAYTFQLYFDFSGYSDMAIGIARMFGIVLPLNFYSPYKATNISEFWRRWHITLSTFLRDYLYIALGGNRKGAFNRYRNLFITMLLGGLWHGAGWNFIIWGGLHGIYLCIHQVWAKFAPHKPHHEETGIGKFIAWSITFFSVVFAWVFFRATDFSSAMNIINGMLGLHGISLPNAILSRLESIFDISSYINISSNQQGGSTFAYTWLWIVSLTFLSLVLPNIKQVFARIEPALSEDKFSGKNSIFSHCSSYLTWKPNMVWAAITSLLFTVGLLTLGQVSEFLYFQF
tara:strand:- start:2082 stop:3641 length:1560 start_codon:yes stop_codon:yes gene_type:complete